MITSEHKVNTPLDRAMRGLVWAAMDKAHVFKTLFLTPSGEWSENESEADWYKWHNLPNGAWCCDVRHESYWLIDGQQYTDRNEAFWAMYDELFVKPAVVPVLQIVAKEQKRHERTMNRLAAKYGYAGAGVMA